MFPVNVNQLFLFDFHLRLINLSLIVPSTDSTEHENHF